MTSLSHHLIPSLLSIIFIFTTTTTIHGSSTEPPTNICPPFDCGNGDTIITYPFWQYQQTQQPHQHYCGYHSLNLSCINGQNNPVINLSNHLFHVKTINYSENSLTISYSDDQTTQQAPDTCPKILHNDLYTLTDVLSSNYKLFNFTLYNKRLRFFYNCSLFPPSLPDITCLRSGSKRSYVFWDSKIPEFDWNGYCETFSNLLVNENVVDVDGDGDVWVLVSRALSEGFKLTWRTPIGACQACEASDGFCGFNNATDESFFCICPDGVRHSFHCGDKGELSFGGLLIIAAVAFYFVHKKRVALYKPVSHK
ncbi:hypothetical protein LWI29_029145 [Acer saccharum]|uniref:non-specific serine/threonine protein kinase n=1 Tax=Acer saccharum TaxID=4024 RepID=A0AA39W8Y5_ACESA|nr:hypothetical protein LWI29_029145 [Acer saccharum]